MINKLERENERGSLCVCFFFFVSQFPSPIHHVARTLLATVVCTGLHISLNKPGQLINDESMARYPHTRAGKAWHLFGWVQKTEDERGGPLSLSFPLNPPLSCYLCVI